MEQERTRRSEREKKYNRYKPPSEGDTTESETRNGIVETAELLNFRSTPDRKTRSNIIAELKKHTKFQILEERRSGGVVMWKVRLEDGREGYVASQFCKEV